MCWGLKLRAEDGIFEKPVAAGRDTWAMIWELGS